MAEPRLQIEQRVEKIEAALGVLADVSDQADVVRAILYGGEGSRGEGDSVSVVAEQRHTARDIAETYHEIYCKLAPHYSDHPTTITSWKDLTDGRKELLIDIIAEMLNDDVIRVGS